eukprot:503677-Alexandrium_andersonii.AAC.1
MRAGFAPSEPDALENLSAQRPPTSAERLERRKRYAEAWRTCPARPLREGARRAHLHRHKRASGPSARRG